MQKHAAALRPVSTKKNAAKSQPRAGRPFAPGYGLAQDEKGLLPWTWVAKQMSGCRTFWVATIHPSNRPHVMPVWGVWVDDAFYFSTGRKSRKGRNLAANPACTITNDDGEEASLSKARRKRSKTQRHSTVWQPLTRKSTRWIHVAWASRSLSCVRARCLGLSRRVFRSRRRGGGWGIS